MQETSNKRAVLVGIFLFIGLVILLGGIIMIGNLHETFKKKMEIVSLFDDISGLQKGNNIWFSGVKIGTVSDIRFFGKSQVAVNMKIETKSQQYIRKDAKVKISSDGLIGNKILVIYGGTSMAAAVETGDTLVVEKTFTTEDMINMLQENNKNVLAITTDFKAISKHLAAGEGTLGKLLKDNTVYDNITAATISLQQASAQAQQLILSLNTFSAGLNRQGTLANQLVTDTLVFASAKASVLQLQQVANSASEFVTGLKEAGKNPNSTIGVLLHDEVSGAHLRTIIKNLEVSSVTLNEDLLAIQHNFLLKGFFKKKAKNLKKENEK